MSRKVLVLGEVRDGSLRNVSFEAIAAAKTIASGGEVVGVLIGDAVNAFSSGVNSVWSRSCGYSRKCSIKTIYS